jgi:hypothetical protein
MKDENTITGFKEIRSQAIGGGKAGVAVVTGDVMAKINLYALKELSLDDVYVRKILMAHNLVDRDRERFSETILDDFAATLPGKSFLYAHDRGSFFPLGLFFDAKAQEMTPEQFATLTGETPRMGEAQTMAKVVWAWFYIMKTPDHESIITNIEGGTYRHVSIGFRAADLAPVKGPYDQTLYWEYAGPGEATEGSLVWLGAQNGATTQKAAMEKHQERLKQERLKQEQQHKETTMKTLLMLMGKVLGKSFDPETTEETLVQSVKSVLEEKDAKIAGLEKQAGELKLLADEGKAYRQSLVDEYARLKACLKECDETPEAAETIKGFAQTMPVGFLQTEIKALSVRMEEAFPDTHTLKGDDRRDKSKDGEKKNALIPKE